jgi:hypothetical protein
VNRAAVVRRTRALIIFNLIIAGLGSFLLTLLTVSPPQVNPDWARLDAWSMDIPQPLRYPWPSATIQAMLFVTMLALLWLSVGQDVSGSSRSPKHTVGMRPASSRQSHHLLTLLGVLLLGFGLRLHTLTRLPLVVDEIGLAAFASDILHGQHIPLFAPGLDANPVTPSWLYALAMHIWGQNAFAIRLMPLFISLLAIPAAYALGRAWWSPRVGLLAAAFLATYPAHVYISRMAIQTYGDPTCSFLALACLARRDATARDYVLAGVFAGLNQYFYHGAKLVVVVMAVYLALAAISRWRSGVSQRPAVKTRQPHPSWVVAAFMLVTLPRIATYLVYHLPFSGNANMSTLGLFPDWPSRLLRAGLTWVYQPDTSLYWRSDSALIPSLALLAFAAGVIVALRGARDLRLWVLLLMVILTTVVGGGIFQFALLYVRYLSALPAMAIFIALGVDRAGSFITHRREGAQVQRKTMQRIWVGCGIGVQLWWSGMIVQGVYTSLQHAGEAYAHVTTSHWQQDDLARQAAALPPGTAAVFVVPPTFADLEKITLAHYVAAYGVRRAVVVNPDDSELLAEQIARLGDRPYALLMSKNEYNRE